MNPENTYENAKALADKQIANERVVTDDLDATESAVLEFWDEYIKIPYGQRYAIRVRTGLSNTDHLRFCQLLDSVETTSQKSDNIFIEALVMITLGIYENDDLVAETNHQFWADGKNWSTLKINRIIEAYFRYFKEESEKLFSFLDEETK